MPVAQLTSPAGAFGLPIGSTSASLVANGGALCQEVVNNSGAHLSLGDVVVWDTSTATSAVSTTTTGSQQLAVTATSYAVASSAAFGTSGPIVAVGVTTSLGGTPQNLFGVISAKADGTHVTVAWARAGAAGSLPAGTVLFVPPVAAAPNASVGASFIGATGAMLPAVTYSVTAAANDPNVAGVVCPFSDSGTVAGTPLVAPGQSFMMAVGGVARVNIGGGTVAAGGLLCTAAAAQPGIADDTPATIGCLIGVALESQANKDAQSTIRAIIKIG